MYFGLKTSLNATLSYDHLQSRSLAVYRDPLTGPNAERNCSSFFLNYIQGVREGEGEGGDIYIERQREGERESCSKPQC